MQCIYEITTESLGRNSNSESFVCEVTSGFFETANPKLRQKIEIAPGNFCCHGFITFKSM